MLLTVSALQVQTVSVSVRAWVFLESAFLDSGILSTSGKYLRIWRTDSLPRIHGDRDTRDKLRGHSGTLEASVRVDERSLQAHPRANLHPHLPCRRTLSALPNRLQNHTLLLRNSTTV